MTPYHKIQTVFKRNPENMKHLLEGQYAKPEFEWLAENEWELTEKIDGTNIRVIWDKGTLEFRGKSDRAEIPNPLLQHLENTFGGQTQWFQQQFPEGVTLYGEGYGGKIQSPMGKKYQEEQRFVLFDIHAQLWFERHAVEGIANTLGVEVVPVLGRTTLPGAVTIVKNGFNSEWGDFEAEGVIARPVMELNNKFGHRIITKIKCKDFPRET